MAIKAIIRPAGAMIVPLMALSLLCGGCQGGKGSSGQTVQTAELNQIQLAIPNGEGLTLASYDVSDFTPDDSMLYCMNYKTGSIDIFNVPRARFERSIKLHRDGPDAIAGGVVYLHRFGDGIVLFDNVYLYHLDMDGHVVSRKQLPDSESGIVSRNAMTYAANILCTDRTVVYPVLAADSIRINRYEFACDSVTSSFVLPSFSRNDESTSGYGFMIMPNITLTDSLAVYNFPFSSRIYAYNYHSGEKRMIDAVSAFTGNAEKCASDGGEEFMFHGLENVHYMPVEYLPEAGMYFRLALGPTKMKRTDNMLESMLSRPFYLMAFNSDFSVAGEWELAADTYNPYFGWTLLPDALVMFRDNKNNSAADGDSLRIDLLRFKPVK